MAANYVGRPYAHGNPLCYLSLWSHAVLFGAPFAEGATHGVCPWSTHATSGARGCYMSASYLLWAG